MQTRAFTTTVTLFAVAALATAAGTAPAARSEPEPVRAAQSAQQRVGLPVLVDCLGHAQVRPSDFLLACGDGNSRLASLHWSRWGTGAARAEGVNWVNDCKPYCAVGRFHAYRVSVKLDRPQPWETRPQVSHYSRITLVYADDRPERVPRVVSYPLSD
ncbi:hypothetical protein [Streptomyces sp. NPDC020489]|uniref:hypothetical protein n=1 Tax=Streptomyces sp. NPDC020489 TaxID=3365077 RepID=UPI00378C7142